MSRESMEPERSSSPKALHNFTMPGGLRWGNQRFLRCMKVNSNGQISAVERRPNTTTTSSASGSQTHLGHGGDGFSFRPEKRLRTVDGGVGIAAVREKVILDLQTAADKMKDAIFRREKFENCSGEPPFPSSEINRDLSTPMAEEGVRPWSLRTRRTAFKLVDDSTTGAYGGGAGASAGAGVCGGGMNNLNMDVIKPNVTSLRVSAEPTPKLRSGTVAGVVGVVGPVASSPEKERPKFSVSLTRQEIEEDFMAMVAHRPPRRPKKRAKYIQKQLDTLFPGLWLTEITADIYKVPETQ